VLVKPGGAAAEGLRAGLLGFPWLFKSSWGWVSLEAAEKHSEDLGMDTNRQRQDS